MVTPQVEQPELLEVTPDADAPPASDTAAETEVLAPDVAVATETPSEAAPAAETAAEPAPSEPATPSPYELPSELRTPPTPDLPAALPNADQQELEYLRGRQQEWSQFQQTQQQEQGIRQWHQYYVNQGYDDQTAQTMANIRRDAHAEAQQTVQGERQAAQLPALKQRAAEKVGRELNVHPADVVSGGTPEDMIWRGNAIKHMAKQGDTIAALTKRLEAVEQRQVPEQHMDGGSGSNGVAPTTDNIDALFMAEEIRINTSANPNQPNRHENQYRAFLSRQ